MPSIVFLSPAFVKAAKAAARVKKTKAVNPEMEEFTAKAVASAKRATAASASPVASKRAAASR